MKLFKTSTVRCQHERYHTNATTVARITLTRVVNSTARESTTGKKKGMQYLGC